MDWKGLFLFLILVSASCFHGFHSVTEIQENNEDRQEHTILIDNSHQELFGHAELTKAFDYTKETTNMNVEIQSNRDALTDTLLSFIDLLVLPAIHESASFSRTEIQAIRNYIKEGGSVLTLSLPKLPYKKFEQPNFEAFDNLFGFTGISFTVEEGQGDLVHNYENANIKSTFNGTLLSINKTRASKNITTFFSKTNNIIVRSSSLTVPEERNFSTIDAPPYSFSVSGPSIIKRNQKLPVLVAGTPGTGRFINLGFGRAFTNLSSPLQKPWIDLGGNKVFFSNLLKWLISEQERTSQTFIPPLYIYLSFGISGAFLGILALFSKREKPKKRKRKKKLSDVLREVREKEKKDKK